MTINKKQKYRIDELLVKHRFASDLKHAKALLISGKVIVNNQRIDKADYFVPIDVEIRIRGQKKWVSRGGEKLESVILGLNLENLFQNKIVLDIGASTGGFTQCALKYGAKSVLALDVGKAQLDWALRTDTRVINCEKSDIRSFEANKYPQIDIFLADISFNGFSRLAESIASIPSSKEAFYLMLVKPQFELNRSEIPKGGVVVDSELRLKAIKQSIDAFEVYGLKCVSTFDSQIKGKSGNQETFMLLKRNQQE